jgi:quercetin dioxygenase-like cupin family protein
MEGAEAMSGQENNRAHRSPEERPTGDDGGRSYIVGGGELITWKVLGRAGDAYSLFENVTQPGYAGSPPHRHLSQDESFYILAGEFTFWVDGPTIRAPTGTTVHAPRGTLHTFQHSGTTLGRMLGAVGPAGDFEAFVREVGEPTQAQEPPVPSGPPRPEVIAQVALGAQRHHIEIPPSPSSVGH